ncbi:MAG: sodium:solute symporter [Planctomycetota bacterium]|nr:sodium:solute symporter [Planctomycetota bacterium]
MLAPLDLAILILYIAGIVSMGGWFFKRSRTTEGFTKAAGRLPGWVVGLSIFGTYVSSISFLANPGKSYAANWNPWVFGLSLPLVAWIACKWFVPFYRNQGHISAYAHLEHRFGAWARTYAGICYLLTQLARVASILYLVAIALKPLTGWDVSTIIIITGILVTLYTLLGGIEAVIWTDVVQSIVLTFGAIFCVALILMGMPEGPGQIFMIASEHGKFSLGSLSLDLTSSTFWVLLAFGFVINLQNFGIDQSYVQRYHTARDEKAAKKSVWIAALLYIPISGLLFFVGTALFAFYLAQPELLPAGDYSSDDIFPHFIATQLPPGATGLLVAAIFAAAMSSVDTSLNSSSTLILEDFYKRYINPNASERGSMRVLYLSTLVLGIGGTLFAINRMGEENVLDDWWKLSGIFAGGILGLFLLGMIARTARWPAALVGVLCGLALILWMTFSPEWSEDWARWRSPFHNSLIVVFSTMTIFAVGMAITAMSKPKTRD